MSSKKKLVIIGGGYSGINLIKELKKYDVFDITLINKAKNHIHQTDIHKYLNAELNLGEISFSLEEFSKRNGVNFLCEEVSDIDFKNQKIKVSSDLEDIDYDYLTIASGSASFFPRQIKNIEEYAVEIKDQENLIKYQQEFLKLCGDKRKGKNIAIIGGGLSGVEIALEFAQRLQRQNIKDDELSISLVEQCDTILPNNDPFLIDTVTKTCDDLKIKRFHGSFVNEIRDNKIFLSNDSEIDFDMIVVVIGVSCNKITSDEEIQINVKNQMIVDEYLRIPQYKNVFVVGDMAETKDDNGNYNPPTAQLARLHAQLTAKNLLHSVQNTALTKNDLKTKGVMIDLAGKSAVGLIFNYKVKGMIAYYLKRFVSNIHTKLFK